MRIGTFAAQLSQDLRYAVRVMGANPLFCVMAAMSLALGIGANTAIYSFLDAIMLRSLPVADPQSLVSLNWRAKSNPAVVHRFSGSSFHDSKYGYVGTPFSYPSYRVLNENHRIWSSLFTFANASRLNVTFRGQADIAAGTYVSGDFFRGLGVQPACGRLLGERDDYNGTTAVVLSFNYAQRRFGDAAKSIGQTILINDQPFLVAGVPQREFFGVNPAGATDVFVPLRAAAMLDPYAGATPDKKYSQADFYWVQVMGRLQPGVSLAQAQAEAAPVFHNWVESTATTAKDKIDLPELLLQPAAGGLDFLRRRYSEPLYVILTVVGLILALACVNIANLLLARSAARSREMALRLSLGAGRWRVVRQLLTESVLLAVAGGAAGVLFAIWGIHFLTALLSDGRENFTLHADLNWRVLAVTLGLSLLTGILFGLAPAIQAARTDLTPALKSARASASGVSFGRGWRRIRLSGALVAAQVAISLLLLVGAALFVRSLGNLHAVDLGFNRENLLLFTVNAKQAGYKDQALVHFYADLRNKLAGLPGVRSATGSEYTLVSGSSSSSDFTLPGQDAHKDTWTLQVIPAFFETMQIPILLGRGINDRDTDPNAPVAVVNEVFARKFFDGESPLGRRFTFVSGKRTIEIVGIAKDARYNQLKGDIPPTAYLAYAQSARLPGTMSFELRAAGDPLALASAVRKTVREANDRIPVTDLKTQAATIDQTIQQEVIFAKLCGAFAVLALLIAAVGLYGTMAYAVARRTGEIGIRMALGARSGKVVWMVLREALMMTAGGLTVGLPAAYMASQLVESYLFGVKAHDPLAIAGAAAAMIAAAVAASYWPAWRASRIDPMTALRQE